MTLAKAKKFVEKKRPSSGGRYSYCYEVPRDRNSMKEYVLVTSKAEDFSKLALRIMLKKYPDHPCTPKGKFLGTFRGRMYFLMEKLDGFYQVSVLQREAWEYVLGGTPLRQQSKARCYSLYGGRIEACLDHWFRVFEEMGKEPEDINWDLHGGNWAFCREGMLYCIDPATADGDVSASMDVDEMEWSEDYT